jgi:hypothetical protein
MVWYRTILFCKQYLIDNYMRKLKQRRNQLQDELYDLHFAEPSPEVYRQRRSEIEYELATIEEAMEFEEKLNPMRVGLIIFAVAGVLAVLITYLFA